MRTLWPVACLTPPYPHPVSCAISLNASILRTPSLIAEAAFGAFLLATIPPRCKIPVALFGWAVGKAFGGAYQSRSADASPAVHPDAHI